MLYEKYTLDVPYEKGGVSADGCKAELTAIIPDRLPNDTRNLSKKALLICPGGGYDYCSVREAEPIAMRFASFGLAAFVLNYSCVKKLFPTNLLELAAAMAFLRDNAERFGIDKNGIYTCGFSAGGHLAASLGVHWNKSFAYEPLGVDAKYIKPNGQILCYPVITSGKKRHDGSIQNIAADDKKLWELASLEKQVGTHTPPTFIWSTCDDNLVPVENTLMFMSALAANKVPFTGHVFGNGVHGLALSDESTANYDGHINKECAEWTELAREWLKKL